MEVWTRVLMSIVALAVVSPAGAGTPGGALPAATWLVEPTEADSFPSEQDSARERESQLYDSGQDALSEGRWSEARDTFVRVAAMKATRADAALYWKAYAENKLGQRADALATIGQLLRSYPQTRYQGEAKELEVAVRRASGQEIRPEDQADDDMKLMALQALQQSNPEQAVPMLEKILRGTSSPRVKSRALFVLAQSDSPKARALMRSVATGASSPDLQRKAIQYLGVHGGAENQAVLEEVYRSTTDVDVKRRVLRAFMVAGQRGRLLAAATSEQSPELRNEAVRQLGVMGAHEELWQLYQKESTVEVKKSILQAMFVGGNADRLLDLARTERNPELRRTAVRNLGLIGRERTGSALAEIYASDKDPAIRKAVIEALFVQGNAESLVAIARKESDPTMRREIVGKLSIMQSKAATDYLMEILEK
jgi:HEAT repeat protein